MRISLLFFFISLVSLKASAQDGRRMINGIISSDSTAVENIHIINKSSRKATISDKKGVFRIPVKKNDTLLISSIQFKNEVIIINELNTSTLKLIVTLKLKINSLDEVTVRKPKNIAKELGLPNAGKKPLNKLESRLNYHSKASLPVVILLTLLAQRGGLEDLYYIISGDRRKDRKLSSLLERDRFETFQQQQLQHIRTRLTDTFFVETLKIPSTEIDSFIKYCDSKDIFYLYGKDRTLEVIDIFIKESEGYLKKLQEEK